MNTPEIYGVPLPAEEATERGHRLPYFYLHGQAEKMNGYDICTCSVDTYYYALQRGVFVAKYSAHDSEEQQDAVVFVRMELSRMQGLICLCDDLQGIEQVLEAYGRHVPFSLYEHHKEVLKKQYPDAYKLLQLYLG